MMRYSVFPRSIGAGWDSPQAYEAVQETENGSDAVGLLVQTQQQVITGYASHTNNKSTQMHQIIDEVSYLLHLSLRSFWTPSTFFFIFVPASSISADFPFEHTQSTGVSISFQLWCYQRYPQVRTIMCFSGKSAWSGGRHKLVQFFFFFLITRICSRCKCAPVVLFSYLS